MKKILLEILSIFIALSVVIGLLLSRMTISNDDFVEYMISCGYSSINSQQSNVFVIPFTADTCCGGNIHIKGDMVKIFNNIYILNKEVVK